VQRQGGKVRQGIAWEVAECAPYHFATLDVTAFVHRHERKVEDSRVLLKLGLSPRPRSWTYQCGSGWPRRSDESMTTPGENL
jgi:hypothetical protein